MPHRENPFTPTFGEVPAYMAGRSQLIGDMIAAFERSGRSPDLSTVVSGARGTGKTALLSLIAEEARKRGWISVGVTALPGMLEDIEERTLEAAEHLVAPDGESRIAGIGIAQIISVEWERSDRARGNWRTRMNRILDALAETDTGLLITVDEVQSDLDEMIQLAAVYQHFVREGRKAALIMAGLPHSISTLLQDKTVSFLRRSVSHHLGRVDDYEIEDAFAKTVRLGGRAIQKKALDRAVQATNGFPFMMQLVGYRSWEQDPLAAEVTVEHVELGISIAEKELKARVLDSTYRSLSDGDIRFLHAMLADEGESRMADIAARMGVTPSYAGQYRNRLLAHGVIGERRRGVVAFELPAFRDYLAEQES